MNRLLPYSERRQTIWPEETVDRFNLVYCLLACHLQVETDIAVTRIEHQCPFIVQYGRRYLTGFIIGVSQIIIYLRRIAITFQYPSYSSIAFP